MFKIGQKVVCKNGQSVGVGFPIGIEKDKIYTIDGISTCACGRELISLSEVDPIDKCCGHTGVDIGVNSNYYSYRFEPLKYDSASNLEVVLEILGKSIKVPSEKDESQRVDS